MQTDNSYRLNCRKTTVRYVNSKREEKGTLSPDTNEILNKSLLIC